MLRLICLISLAAIALVPDWASAFGRRRVLMSQTYAVSPPQFVNVSPPYAGSQPVYTMPIAHGQTAGTPVYYQTQPLMNTQPVVYAQPVMHRLPANSVHPNVMYQTVTPVMNCQPTLGITGAVPAATPKQMPDRPAPAPTATKPDEVKLTEPKVVEPKRSEPKIVEPKPAEVKLSEPKSVEPKIAEPKLTEPKLTEPKLTEPKLTEPKLPGGRTVEAPVVPVPAPAPNNLDFKPSSPPPSNVKLPNLNLPDAVGAPVPSPSPVTPTPGKAAPVADDRLPQLPKIDLDNLSGSKDSPQTGVVPASAVAPVPTLAPPTPAPAPVLAPLTPTPAPAPIPLPELPKQELPKLELPKLDLPKIDLPGLAIPAAAAPGDAPAAKSTSRSSPVNGSAFDTYPVAGEPPASPADRRAVRFFNLSDRDMKLTVNGVTGSLPRGTMIAATVPAKFEWQVEGGEPQQTTIPTTAPGMEVVIRK